MQVKAHMVEYAGEDIIVEEISFGQSMYIYIGDRSREFNNLSLTMPQTLAATTLLGDKPADECGSLLSEITKKPVLASYAFPLESEKDLQRYDFVKMFLRKIYAPRK